MVQAAFVTGDKNCREEGFDSDTYVEMDFNFGMLVLAWYQTFFNADVVRNLETWRPRRRREDNNTMDQK